MAFYDLHVHTTLSIGENSVAEMAEFARRLGISGIGVVRYYNGKTSELPAAEGVDVVNAIMLKPSSVDELAETARRARKDADVLMVHGGDYTINRAACENPYVDVLCHPELGRKDSGLDHICIKAAAENNVALEVNFREILDSYRRKRVYVLGALKKNLRLAQKYSTKVVTTSGAVTAWGLRSGRDMAAITHLLGTNLGSAIDSVSATPEELVRTNREKNAGMRWEGVRVVDE